MYYTDTLLESTAFAKRVLPLMVRQSIPAHPINYAVWYEYVSGRNEALTAAIEARLAKGQPFSEEVNWELFRRYLGGKEEKAVADMHAALRRVLSDILKHAIRVGGEAADHEQTLQTYSSQLIENLDVQEIRRIVDGIISETNTLQDSGKGLRDRLQETTRELETMRRDFEQAKIEARVDALTGLANRKAFDEKLLGTSAQATESGSHLCLLLADIDHFKKFNDTYGHLVGDEALKFVGAILKKCVRGGDMVARFGGEEFVVLLPDTPLKGALSAAENIRSTFCTTKLRRRSTGQSVGSVTVSIGVALYRPGEPLQSFVDRADAALYWSKEQGRNRVSSEQELRIAS